MVYGRRLGLYGLRHGNFASEQFTPCTQVDSIRLVEPEAHSYSNHQKNDAEGWIKGAFFVLERVFNYIEGARCSGETIETLVDLPWHEFAKTIGFSHYILELEDNKG